MREHLEHGDWRLALLVILIGRMVTDASGCDHMESYLVQQGCIRIVKLVFTVVGDVGNLRS